MMCVCERWMSDAGCQRMMLGDTFASVCALFLCKLQRRSGSRRCSLTPSKCWRVTGLSADSDSLVAFFVLSPVNCVFRIVVGLQQTHFFGPLISTRRFLRVVQPVSPHWTLQSLCCVFYFLLHVVCLLCVSSVGLNFGGLCSSWSVVLPSSSDDLHSICVCSTFRCICILHNRFFGGGFAIAILKLS